MSPMMTPEERLTKIENAIHALTEAVAQHDSVLTRHESLLAREEAAIRDLIVVSRTFIDSQKEVTTQIQELREAQKHTGAQIQELREAQKHTDETLNALIDTVDRIIRSRNGHGDKG